MKDLGQAKDIGLPETTEEPLLPHQPPRVQAKLCETIEGCGQGPSA